MLIDERIGQSSDAATRSVVMDVCAEVTTECHFVSSKVCSDALFSFRGANCADTILRALAERPRLHCVRGFALGDHLTRIELDEHSTVSFDLFDGH